MRSHGDSGVMWTTGGRAQTPVQHRLELLDKTALISALQRAPPARVSRRLVTTMDGSSLRGGGRRREAKIDFGPK